MLFFPFLLTVLKSVHSCRNRTFCRTSSSASLDVSMQPRNSRHEHFSRSNIEAFHQLSVGNCCHIKDRFATRLECSSSKCRPWWKLSSFRRFIDIILNPIEAFQIVLKHGVTFAPIISVDVRDEVRYGAAWRVSVRLQMVDGPLVFPGLFFIFFALV